MSDQYEVYPRTGPAGPQRWQVVIEHANRGQQRPPTVVVAVAREYPSREDAMAEARSQAFSFRPPDPVSPQRRQVLRDTDGYLVLVKGAMTTFHFTTRVMLLEGEVDHS